MRALLVHNADAGDGPSPGRAEMVEALGRFGWSVTALDARDLGAMPGAPADVVVAAGGDGTVSRVARRLAGTGIPIGVIPTGTANNVARTLGIHLDPRSAVEALGRSSPRDVDLGVALTGYGKRDWFLEGFGVGVFAQVMAEQATDEHKRMDRASRLLARELAGYAPLRTRIEVDGRDASGDYLLVSALNLRSVGPALQLAPDARSDDGMLDLVLVRPDDRELVIAHLLEATPGQYVTLPPLEHHRARHLRIGDYGRWAHVDDRSRELEGDVEIRVAPRAVRFLLPAPAQARAAVIPSATDASEGGSLRLPS